MFIMGSIDEDDIECKGENDEDGKGKPQIVIAQLIACISSYPPVCSNLLFALYDLRVTLYDLRRACLVYNWH